MIGSGGRQSNLSESHRFRLLALDTSNVEPAVSLQSPRDVFAMPRFLTDMPADWKIAASVKHC